MPLKTEFETGLPNHRKTWRLASALGHNFTAVAVGIIHNLHDWAVNTGVKPPGILPEQPDPLWDQIFSCGIPAQAVLNALVESGWLDRDGDNLRLHEWENYAGAVFARMDAAARRKAEYRDKMRQSKPGPGSVPGTGTGRRQGQDNITNTNHHNQDHSPLTTHHDHSPKLVTSTSDFCSPDGERNGDVMTAQRPNLVQERFDLFWQNCPKKVGKKAVLAKFSKLSAKDQDLAAHVMGEHGGIWAGADTQTFPDPLTWINQGRWSDDLAEVRRRADRARRETAQRREQETGHRPNEFAHLRGL